MIGELKQLLKLDIGIQRQTKLNQTKPNWSKPNYIKLIIKFRFMTAGVFSRCNILEEDKLYVIIIIYIYVFKMRMNLFRDIRIAVKILSSFKR